ncbi:MAG: 3-methyl-2-oxobutanoate dehydrogenase subunit VorB [Candidatus Hydrogenedentes bacterium]|nr:3-methyl-2-oxobutanoate dehydrogenase subunit VorB [Candidatus Hydrogenedentota bacterium]
MNTVFTPAAQRNGKLTLVQGNIALAEGALHAGLDCYFGYPITPQNQVPEYLSAKLPERGGAFVQAESELASINMVLGAASTGARAMTSSSGPGISLMQEGISFLAGDELPAVIANVMRCGPGMGGIKPTQGDYYQATRGGGHGDYHTIVLAPASAQEMFDLTYQAFDVADTYCNPVLILADAILGQMKEPAVLEPPYERKAIKKDDWSLTGAAGRKARNIRSMLLAGDDQEQLNYKLEKKYERVKQELPMWECIDTEDADLIVVAFGTSARISSSAARLARAEGLKVGVFRPITLFPFPEEALRDLASKVGKFLVVEMNLGQMLHDVRAIVGHDIPVSFYGRPGGGVPTVREVLENIKESVS